jgi:hypothetical protein
VSSEIQENRGRATRQHEPPTRNSDSTGQPGNPDERSLLAGVESEGRFLQSAKSCQAPKTVENSKSPGFTRLFDVLAECS